MRRVIAPILAGASAAAARTGLAAASARFDSAQLVSSRLGSPRFGSARPPRVRAGRHGPILSASPAP
ncbi:MAG TPA: hypothetical protein PLB26_15895, partial [Rubrivivax sp.]|nr:hypothetical protein [Rubrivivax sp.]